MIKRACAFFWFLSFCAANTFAQEGADSVERRYGLSLGVRSFLIHDELESFRNFSGMGVPVALSIGENHLKKEWAVNGSFGWARLQADPSRLVVSAFTSSVDFLYLVSFTRDENASLTFHGGVNWINQLSTRTYNFNSTIGGQNPFTGEFFSSPELTLHLRKKLREGRQLDTRLGSGLFAYLISRDYHPIRGYQRFRDVPKELVFTDRFFDLRSEVSFTRPVGTHARLSVAYKWRYLQYRRSYVFQMGNQEIAVTLFYTHPKK
jgi:hypothetical protein